MIGHLRGRRRAGDEARGCRGVTIVELITIGVVLAILAAFAIPGFSPVVLQYRVRGAAWQVAGDLRLARQRAVTLKQRFRVCATSCGIAVPAGSYSVERDQGAPSSPQWVSDTGVATRLPRDVDRQHHGDAGLFGERDGQRRHLHALECHGGRIRLRWRRRGASACARGHAHREDVRPARPSRIDADRVPLCHLGDRLRRPRRRGDVSDRLSLGPGGRTDHEGRDPGPIHGGDGPDGALRDARLDAVGGNPVRRDPRLRHAQHIPGAFR